MENVFFEFEEKIMSRNHRLIVGSVMFEILEYDIDLEISLDTRADLRMKSSIPRQLK